MNSNIVNSSGNEPSSKFRIGPGILVTAAFIGPGTVTTASLAGAKFGFNLLWAVAFSIFATIVLQEMAARLGIVTGNGLAESVKSSIKQPVVKWAVLVLVLVAILFGNAAYQTGNILGAATGVDVLATTPGSNSNTGLISIAVFAIGVIALCVIWIGRYELLQSVLTILVVAMSVLFVVAALLSNPDWAGILNGFKFAVPEGADWLVIGLVGTTVVPYNLFLHASATAQQSGDLDQPAESAIRFSRWDTVCSVLVGGLVTSAILVTASAAFHGNSEATSLSKVADVAIQLEPALGKSARWLFAIGLFAAGLTSAITAPIAAAYAASGCFGWTGKLSDWRLKSTASIVIAAGVCFGVAYGSSPKDTIIIAQAANGLLLPVIALLLLWMSNKESVMKNYRNGVFSNLLAAVVIVIVLLIAYRNLHFATEAVKKRFENKSASTSILIPSNPESHFSELV